jgi:hypothetical protein
MTILEVPDIPPSPNVLKRKYRHPLAYKKLRTMWEWALYCSPCGHHRKALKEQAKKVGKLEVQITMHHARFFDPDNLAGAQKVVLDALVNIGFLGGDSPDKLNLLPAVQVQCRAKDQKTVVKIGVPA